MHLIKIDGHYRLHTRMRCEEKVGVEMSDREYHRLCERIKSGEVKFVQPRGQNAALYRLTFKKKALYAVFRLDWGQIVTCWGENKQGRSGTS
ncbi:MAG: hypothetical protein HY459_01155 [Parcubacteria group bacterium]|nr:hypothetical protein [Parcubacteria group bacterium]